MATPRATPPGATGAEAPGGAKTTAETVTTEKTGRPHAHFAEPIDIVDDQAMSHAQKAAALESLEQDARQMAAASSEGMGGGEPTALRAVLTAQASLALPPVEAAYETVARDLQRRRGIEPVGGIHDAIDRAIEALDALAGLSQPGQDAAKRDAAAELADELRRERLDP